MPSLPTTNGTRNSGIRFQATSTGLLNWGFGDWDGLVVHFLDHPKFGVGIARQPGPGCVAYKTLCCAWENVVGVHSIFSVDVDLTPCQLLALRRKTLVATVDQLLHEEGPTEVDILQGDVSDPRWWITTLVDDPFDWMAWSSRCVSFSKAGSSQINWTLLSFRVPTFFR